MSRQQFTGWTSAEQFAAEQERLYQQRNQAIASQLCRDSRPPRAGEMLKFFLYVGLGVGLFFAGLYWLASSIGRLLENL